MMLTFCVGKIHRATVTDADLNYIGSVTIDEDLVNAAGLFAGQLVKINNLRNGVSWETYIVKGKAGKGEICLNGPPAHHFEKGDMVIILGYALVDEKDAKDGQPTIVFVDEKNKITEIKK
ncbi:MAG: aspartate 1-decarboxylase [Candidatus Staskawiczbacteria bacterium]|nr:aspartate 1-decarboxylase [Candidatus Staskawiczbacteria bacterium]